MQYADDLNAEELFNLLDSSVAADPRIKQAPDGYSITGIFLADRLHSARV